jgi:hypothetical protein
MSFIVVRDGKRTERHLEGSWMLAEILTDDEYQRLEKGTLVALTESGGLMSLDSPLTAGQTVILRPLQPEKDLAGFGFPINRVGDVVGISEVLAIRKYEEQHGADVYELTLDEIRRRVRGGESTPAVGSARAEADRDVDTLLVDLSRHGEETAVARLRHTELGARDRLLAALARAICEQGQDLVKLAQAILRVVGGVGDITPGHDHPTFEDQRWAGKAARGLVPSSVEIVEQCDRLGVQTRVTAKIKAPPFALGGRAPVSAAA